MQLEGLREIFSVSENSSLKHCVKISEQKKQYVIS